MTAIVRGHNLLTGYRFVIAGHVMAASSSARSAGTT